MPDDSPKQFGAEVAVTMKDGRRLSRRIDHLVCRGGDNPMSTEELFEKFEDCAARSLAHDQVAPLFERLETLETVADLDQVTGCSSRACCRARPRSAWPPPRSAPSPARKRRPGCLDALGSVKWRR